MRNASAVLITDGPRVLAFRRHDAEGLSLPCGKQKAGEDTAGAAIREAEEETGFKIALASAEPFVGFDVAGNHLVTTYRGEIAGGELLTSPTGEGTPLWASIREICRGPFWHYNERALRHFGVPIPLAGKFHSHLTIESRSAAEDERAAALTGGKLTVIELEREGRTQRDVMITHHYVTSARGLEDENDVLSLLKARGRLLADCGIKVLRVKLEYDLLHDKSDPREVREALSRIYTEIHVKCILWPEALPRLVAAAREEGWHPSRNPFAVREDGQVVQFVNRRFYGDHERHIIDEATDSLVLGIRESVESVEEIKYETAVYDSNDDLDHWWMAAGQAEELALA